jgi:hypothetical protein
MKQRKWLEILAFAYIILFPVKFLRLPVVGTKLQPADFLFLILLAMTLPIALRLDKWQFSRIDKAVGGWLLAHTVTCAIHPTQNAVLEWVGTVYLVLLYGVFQLFFMEKNKTTIQNFWLSAAQTSVIAAAGFGVLGVVLIAFDIRTPLVFPFENYPYFGTVYRAMSYVMQPIMLASVLSVLGFFALAKSQILGFSKYQIGVLGLIIIALFFTFAKSVLLFFSIALLYLTHSQSIIYKRLTQFSVAVSFVLYLLSAHFILQPRLASNQPQKPLFFFVAHTPSVSTDNFYLLKTGYTMLKEKEWFYFLGNPIFGIGADNLKLKPFREDAPDYPIIRGFEPHSSITGVLAELGLVGFLALIGLFGTLFFEINQLSRIPLSTSERSFLYAFACVFLYMIGEAVATDVMNFRHYWLSFAFFSIWAKAARSEIQSY